MKRKRKKHKVRRITSVALRTLRGGIEHFAEIRFSDGSTLAGNTSKSQSVKRALAEAERKGVTVRRLAGR